MGERPCAQQWAVHSGDTRRKNHDRKQRISQACSLLCLGIHRADTNKHASYYEKVNIARVDPYCVRVYFAAMGALLDDEIDDGLAEILSFCISSKNKGCVFCQGELHFETWLTITWLSFHSLLWNLDKTYCQFDAPPMVCVAAWGALLDDEIDARFVEIHYFNISGNTNYQIWGDGR